MANRMGVSVDGREGEEELGGGEVGEAMSSNYYVRKKFYFDYENVRATWISK